MRISILKNKFFCWSVMLTVFLGVSMFTTTVNAQKEEVLAAMADLDQCRNGTAGAPVACTGSAWANGAAVASQAHWAESQFIAYRVRLDDLSIGSHTFTIGYDYLKNEGGGPSKHAIDYLGTFNATETSANPCSGVAGCTLGSPTSTFTIPPDTVTVTNNTNPNTGNPIVQIPGQFTMWGGTITAVAYEPLAVGDERRITVTFNATVANPVLAWGGHIAWIGDWGAGNSASSISGSPYHMRNDNLDGSGGNQDRALQAAAVIASGAVFVKKVVNTLDLSGSAVFEFPFTATANFGPTSFGLIDDNGGAGVDTQQSQAITSFGPGNLITVTECSNSLTCPTYPVGWSLAGVSCVETGGLANSTGAPGVPWVPGGPANITVEVGETVTCTFTNTQFQPSAATVAVSGRVMTASGVGVSNARVSMTDQNGNSISTITNRFGYYRFSEVEVGQTYVMNVGSKRYQFAPRVISLSDELTNLDFIAF